MKAHSSLARNGIGARSTLPINQLLDGTQVRMSTPILLYFPSLSHANSQKAKDRVYRAQMKSSKPSSLFSFIRLVYPVGAAVVARGLHLGREIPFGRPDEIYYRHFDSKYCLPVFPD